MKMKGVETVINRSVLISCLAGKCLFPAHNGHHHERSINVFNVLVHFDLKQHTYVFIRIFKGEFFIFQFAIQHSFIRCPADSTVSEDAGIELLRSW